MIWGLPIVVVLIQGFRWLRSRVAPVPPAVGLGDDLTPSVTLLVAAWNAADHIEPFVAAFRTLNLPEFQLVLCAGGQDGTYERALALADSRVTVIRQCAGEGKQGALAKALGHARGEIVYFTDIDCRPTTEVVIPLVQHVRTAPDEVAAGIVRPWATQADNRFVLAQWAVYRASRLGEPSYVAGIDGRNAAVRREILARTRVLEVPAPSGTDYTLAKELLRHGHAIRRVWSEMPTEFPPTLAIYVKKQARWLRNVWLLGGRYRALSEVRRVAMTAAFPVVLAGMAMLGAWFRPAWALAAALVLYSLGNRILYLKQAGFAPYLWESAVLLGGDWSAGLLMLVQAWRGVVAWS
ncbi:MAG: glycosyltransferase [Firmicutes bacterium]|nr:glycosyltransferase [Bacillota bacterium]